MVRIQLRHDITDEEREAVKARMEEQPLTSRRETRKCHTVPGYTGFVRGYTAGTYYPVARICYDGTPWGRSGKEDVYEPRNPFAGTVKWKTAALPNSTDDSYAAKPDPRQKTNSKNRSAFILGDNRDRHWDTTHQVTFVDIDGCANSATRAPMFDDWLERPAHERRKIYDQAYAQVGPVGVKRLEKAVREKIDQRTAGGPFALRKAFKYFDRDGSGDIDPDEFVAAMEHFGLTFTDNEVLAMFGTCDDSDDGALDYYEFIDKVLEKDFVGFAPQDGKHHQKEEEEVYDPIADRIEAEAAAKKKAQKKHSVGAFENYRQRLALKKVFSMFDIDDSGAIDHEELEELLQMAGKDLTHELARSAFRHIDANSDGNITFDEIWEWWMENTSVAEQNQLEKDQLEDDAPVVPPLDFGATTDSNKSWATPAHTTPHSPAQKPTLRPLYKQEGSTPLIPKPPSTAKHSVPNFRVPAQRNFPIPNTPQVPSTARDSLKDTVWGASGRLTGPKARRATGAQTARKHAKKAGELPALNVGRFVEVGNTGSKDLDTGFVNSSLPWAPKTARPHAEHNVSSTSWFGSKFQASTPSGWSTTKLPNKLSTRPSNQPRLQPDGRPAVRTGFRIAQTKDSVQPGEQ